MSQYDETRWTLNLILCRIKPLKARNLINFILQLHIFIITHILHASFEINTRESLTKALMSSEVSYIWAKFRFACFYGFLYERYDVSKEVEIKRRTQFLLNSLPKNFKHDKIFTMMQLKAFPFPRIDNIARSESHKGKLAELIYWSLLEISLICERFSVFELLLNFCFPSLMETKWTSLKKSLTCLLCCCNNCTT